MAIPGNMRKSNVVSSSPVPDIQYSIAAATEGVAGSFPLTNPR